MNAAFIFMNAPFILVQSSELRWEKQSHRLIYSHPVTLIKSESSCQEIGCRQQDTVYVNLYSSSTCSPVEKYKVDNYH